MIKSIILAIREYKAAVKTKGFIIGLVIAPVLMSGSLLAFILLKDRVDTNDKTIAVIDHSGVIVSAVLSSADYHNENEVFDKETGEKRKPKYIIEVQEPDTIEIQNQRLALSDRVRSGELHAFLEIGPSVLHPGDDTETSRIKYYAKNAALDNVRDWLGWPINNQLRKSRLSDAGIEEETVKDLFHWIGVEALGLVSMDLSTGTIEDARKASPIEAIAIPIGMMMLLFLMIMMSVPAMLTSVMEEKTQRIAEVLLGSIKPFEFMLGKLLGGIAVSLTISAVYLIGGITVVTYMGFEHYIPYNLLPWFLTFMLLAILMFGSFASALGSTCSEPKDAQSLNFPMLLPALFPMFVYFPVVKEPLSSFSTWISLIPPFTPLLMLLRMATPDTIPAWQPIAGLIGVVLFTLLMVWTGGRIFRVAILMQGMPPKLSNIVRWAIKG